jgi:hypothetical protein
MKTIAQWWELYEQSCLVHWRPSLAERNDMRCVFYSGFYAGLEGVLQCSRECLDDPELGAAMVESLRQECRRYLATVRDGKE